MARVHKLYEYRIKDYHGDDEWTEMETLFTAEDVASAAAEDYHSNDRGDVNDLDLTIFVREANNPECVMSFNVTAEYIETFYVKQIT